MNPEDDAKGAMAAALDYDPKADIQLVGYRFLEDSTLTAKQRRNLDTDPTVREAFNVKTNEEIQETLLAALDNIREPFRVVFKGSCCMDCAEVGDVRLMSNFCHMEPHLVHPGLKGNKIYLSKV